MPGPWPPAAAAVSIVDDTGRVVELAAPARRLISLFGGYSEILLALGLKDAIVARTQADGYLPELQGKPSVGTHIRPNVELILGLRPDLLLQDAGRQETMPAITQLRQQGIPIAVFHPVSFPQLFSVIERLGILTGTQEEAARLIASMRQRLEAIERKIQLIPYRPRVFYEARYPDLIGIGQGSIINDIIIRAGGRNCLASPKHLVRLSLEELIALAPEVYLLQRGPMNPAPSRPEQRPGFELVPAVREGRILVVDQLLYARPGPRTVEAVEELVRFLHPQLFAGGAP